MARVNGNEFLKGVSGRLGRDFVIKQYSYGTVISKMPEMPKGKKTPLQKEKSTWFAEAVAYAQDIVHDPKKKAAYAKKIPKGKQVYQAAIKAYMAKKKKSSAKK